MIKSRQDLAIYLQADLDAYGIPRWSLFSCFKYPVVAWQRQLRHVEYFQNRNSGFSNSILKVVAKYRFQRTSLRMGFSVPPNVFGKGLCIVHWGTVVVNAKARVGENCRLHPDTCLGANRGSSENSAPTIGRDAYIGPGAKVFGGVTLGDNVRIGANAVVNKNFPSGSILVGIPAKNAHHSTNI